MPETLAVRSLPPLEPGTPPAREGADVFRWALVLAALGAGGYAILHLANALILDRRVRALDADVDGNLMAWISSAAIFAVAAALAALALTRPAARRELTALAAAVAFLSLDETASIHERVGQAGVRLLDLSDPDYGRAIWPILLLPLLAAAFIGLWRLATASTREAEQAIKLGAVLLVLAVAAEMAWAAFIVRGTEVGGTVDAVQVSVEEGVELAGWVLIAVGVASLAIAEVVRLAARGAERA